MAVSASDQRVCQDVYEVLRHDVRLDPTNLSVQVQNRIVHLSGTVPHYIQKAVATQLVDRVKGVRGVQNDLQVVLTRLVTDSEIAAVVRGNLLRDARIDRPELIHVRVAHGVVTLDGSTANHAQVLAAYEDAWAAPGVVDAKSTVFVHPPKRPDPQIADDVRSALARDSIVDDTNVRVHVTDGTVFLRGSVPSYYQSKQAMAAAWGVPGVLGVDNGLTIPEVSAPESPV